MTVDWEDIAPSYRRQLWLERASISTLIGMLTPVPSDRLLDVGTGTAELLRSLSNRPGRPRRAIGVDPCRGMLSRAAPLPDDWTLIRASGEDLPFPDHSFDLVTASWVLHVLDPGIRKRVLAECARVLRPGGWLGTITIAPPQSPVTRVLTAPARWLAREYPSKLIGLKPFDPGPDLIQAGFGTPLRERSFRGYPALCLSAGKPC
jgi:ubiquinone/menaquinone biosynthesis C-methylase UbiE